MLDMREFTDEFVAEARENLAGIEGVLMDLENRGDTPDPERVNRAFRAVHSIKGGAAFLGLTRINELSHAMESLLALVRSHEIRPSAPVIDILLGGVDLLRRMLDSVDGADAVDISGTLAAIEEIRSRTLDADVQADLAVILPLVDAQGAEAPFRIDRFTHRRLPASSRLYVLAYDLNEMATASRETPLALIDGLLAAGEILDARLDAPADDLHGDLGGIPLMFELLYATPESAADLRGRLGSGLRRLDRVESGGGPDTGACEEPGPPGAGGEGPTVGLAVPEGVTGVRISEEKADALVTLAGEFVTVQASLTAEAKSLKHPGLLAIAERVERLSADLRDVAMAVRMLPVHTVFDRFRRLVRDLSRHHGKSVCLKTEGGSAELDKTVLEGLNDPLTHILRNSIDHGMESPEERTAHGKPAEGTITLTAQQAGNRMVIEIADDGAGIDPEGVRRKAVEKGLIAPSAPLDEPALLRLIFTPGFSTTETITDLSGRGVGMDVVKQWVAAIHGDVGIRSRKGRGTTVSLHIPLSMAIIDGLLVRIGESRYFVPLSEASECIDLRGEALARARSRGAMDLRGRLIPYICLAQWLATGAGFPADEYGLIVRSGDGLVGLGVEKVIGFHQAVIKPLGKAYGDNKAFSGSTILGDGGVALILDVQYLIQAHRQTAGKGKDG